MLSDLAEGFAVSIILATLLTASILVSSKVQESSKKSTHKKLM